MEFRGQQEVVMYLGGLRRMKMPILVLGAETRHNASIGRSLTL